MGPEQGSDGTGSWGYLTGFADRYKVGGQVGKGGNGIVNRVVQKATGREYACKVLPKQLADARASEQKKAAHPESVRHEVTHYHSVVTAVHAGSLHLVPALACALTNVGIRR